MAYMERAAKDLQMNIFLGWFELGLIEFLEKNGLDKPSLVRNIFEHAPGDPDLRPELESLAVAAGAKELEVATWADQLNELYELACAVADKAIARIAAVDSFELR